MATKRSLTKNSGDVRFFVGEVTNRGVGIGSTRVELQRAYGGDLQVDPAYDRAVYVVGQRRPSRDDIGYFRPVIYFELSSSQQPAKVVRLEVAPRQQIRFDEGVNRSGGC